MKKRGFTLQKILFSIDGTKPIRKCKKKHYEYSQSDMVWYWDESDEDYYLEVPRNGQKTYTLKSGYKARYKVVMDNC